MAEGGGEDEKRNIPPPPYDSIYPEMPEKLAEMDIEPEKKNGYTDDKSLIIKAADLAARRHRQQRRKDAIQTPYINHPIGVAYILTNEGQITDTATIVAALLHDTVEDTKTTDEEIRQMFGDEAKLVLLADKLYNIRDMKRSTPVYYTKHCVTEHILFTKDLLTKIRGTNDPLENALDEIINKHIN